MAASLHDVLEVGAGEARGLPRDRLAVEARRERLAAACARRGSRGGPRRSGTPTSTWRSKRPGRSSAASSASRRLDAAMTTTPGSCTKPSSSTSSWLSVWSCSRLNATPVRLAPTASSSSMKTMAGACLRAVSNSLRMRDGADAGEHLDEARGRLREEGGAALVRHRLGQQRLAGARRPVEQDALGDARAERREPLGLAQELDDLAQLVLRLVRAGHVVPARRSECCRAGSPAASCAASSPRRATSGTAARAAARSAATRGGSRGTPPSRRRRRTRGAPRPYRQGADRSEPGAARIPRSG